MKKVKLILIALTIIGYCCLSVFKFDIEQKRVASYLGKGNVDFISLEKMDIDHESLDFLQKTAEQYHVLLSETRYETINNKDYLVTYVSVDSLEDLNVFVNIDKITESQYLIPKNSDNADASVYDEFLNNDDYAYSTLSVFWNKYAIKENIKVHYNHQNDFMAFTDALCARFSISNDLLKSNTSYGDTNYEEVMKMIDYGYYAMALFIILIIGLILSYEISSRSKEFAIKKLNGYTQLRLVAETMMSIIAVLFTSILISIIACFIFFHHLGFIKYYVTKTIPLFIFEICLLAFIHFVLLRNVKIYELIKEQKVSSKILFFNSCLRFALYLIICCVFVYIFANFPAIKEKEKTLENFAQYGHYLSFPASSAAYQEDDSTLNDELYKIWNKKAQGMHSDFGCLTDSCSYEVPPAVVNINYLAHFAENFREIPVKDFYELENNEMMVVLMPNDKKEKESLVVDDLIKYHKVSNEKIHIIYYEDAYLPTLSADIKGDGDYTFHNPVIYVFNEYYQNKSLIFGTHINASAFGGPDALRFDPKDMNREEFYDLLMTIADNPNVEKAVPLKYLERLDAKLANEINTLKTTISILSVVAVLFSALYIILVILINQMMIEDERKELAVKWMNGYSLVQMIKPNLMNSILTAIFCSVLLILLLALLLHQSLTAVISSVAVILLMDIAATVIYTKCTLYKRVAGLLKGD